MIEGKNESVYVSVCNALYNLLILLHERAAIECEVRACL